MSKYTTQVRFICEQKAGLTESVGADDIDDVIAASWDQIFTKDVEFFDADYKEELCCKILRHYYLREIGSETAGVWIFWMNTVLSEIMPYYNKLYSSALLELDPFHDTDYTRSGTRAGTQDEKTESSYTDEGANTAQSATSDSGNRTAYDLYSDTPQGALTGVENQTYLTDARKNTDTVSNSGQVTSSGTETKTGERTDTKTAGNAENYFERIAGKMSSTPYSELLQKYRDTFLNIDMMVIKEFDDCFMKLW